jgi:putative spermidine/putrescine transport system substrate-binding protein
MPITRRLLTGATGGLLAAPWIRPAAAEDRTITFAAYSGIFEENYRAAVIEPFMRTHPGIKVNYYAGASSAATLGLLRAQKTAPQIDVAVLDVTLAKAGTDEGLFDTLDAAAVPALTQLSPMALQQGVAGAALTFDNLVLLYAPETVKPPPTSWRVLWDKAYAGQIAVAGVPDIVGVSTVLIANKINGGDYRTSVEKGIAAVADMAPGVLTWDPKPDAYSFIINGQAALAVGWNARGQIYSQGSGGKLAAVLPDEGSLFQINMVEAIKGGRQPEATRVFLDYILGAEAQAAFTNRMFYAPTNAQARPGAEALARTVSSPERMARMLDVDWMAVARIRDGITDQWRRRVLTRR